MYISKAFSLHDGHDCAHKKHATYGITNAHVQITGVIGTLCFTTFFVTEHTAFLSNQQTPHSKSGLQRIQARAGRL
jgi:hypothetical protein